MILSEAYKHSTDFLNERGIDESDFKALCICCHLAGIRNSQFSFCKDMELFSDELEVMLKRLGDGEPLQYVIGKWDFFESEFVVGEGVLIPRPETEELVELAVDYIKDFGDCLVYDLCAGTGCIGLSIAKACPNSRVVLIEKSPEAFGYLSRNAEGVANATIICGDINDTGDFELADVIISNPPYIKSADISTLQNEVLREPHMALDGGNDGLDFYRIINDKWSSVLKPKGILFLEIGDEQGSDLMDLLTEFENIEILKDIYGNDRMVRAVRRD